MHDSLDWLALSIDSVRSATNIKSGRTTPDGSVKEAEYLDICDMARKHNMKLKINTVVTKLNQYEDMTRFMLKARPKRWKIMQMLPVYGQNDAM